MTICVVFSTVANPAWLNIVPPVLLLEGFSIPILASVTSESIEPKLKHLILDAERLPKTKDYYFERGVHFG